MKIRDRGQAIGRKEIVPLVRFARKVGNHAAITS